MATSHLPHLILPNAPEQTNFITPNSSRNRTPIQERETQKHGQFLQQRFNLAWQNATDAQIASQSTRNGIYIEFHGEPGTELITKSMENMSSKKSRLLNVRSITAEDGTDTKTTQATVYIEKSECPNFARKIHNYLTKERANSGNPYNQKFINSISDIRNALLVNSFWTDSSIEPPAENAMWIEVWLSTDDENSINQFQELLSQLNIPSREGHLTFPERTIKVIYANRQVLEQLSLSSDMIAEYKLAKETAAFFMTLNNKEQAEWTHDLTDRLEPNINTRTSVCILDTGINNGHPLISPVLSDQHCHAIDSNWGVHDHDKHGTLMAGTVTFGDITNHLSGNEKIKVPFCLESVKILPPPPNHNQAHLWGYLTSQAISLAEISEPNFNRITVMAVTASDTRDQGKPSSWSATIDQMAAGGNDNIARLIILSAGNTTSTEQFAAANYPYEQLNDSVHDPAQAWNAITVGAFTALGKITDPTLANYNAVAKAGQLSPFSTTSVTWESNSWPAKPDLVLEGGNLAVDDNGFATDADDLKLLSTFHNPTERLFYPFFMTSAASAQLGRMAGILSAKYPTFWPETIRALLIHSSEWTKEMVTQFAPNETKTELKTLLSICGYGVPNLERAHYSAQNRLTLIAETTIQPFQRNIGETCKTKEMHLHKLPWPTDVLLELPAKTSVSMRITLSYFIEPGPGEIGWEHRYRYPSYGLRFHLNAPGESQDEFERRINKDARDDNDGRGHPGTRSPFDRWVLGSQARNRGSVHSDIWKGSAAELASSNLVAVTPTTGWWKERAYLGQCNRAARYALLITISTPSESIDIYTPVATKIGITVPILV